MTVSACIIIKDEWDDLRRCLRSLIGKVDHLSLVCTGDAAPADIKPPCRDFFVEPYGWNDDFAAARNAGLTYLDLDGVQQHTVPSDWWFYIDADEALEGDIRRLCDLLPDNMDGALIPVNNLSADDGQTGTIGSTATQFRLVRNGIGARFEGRIHEQIVLPDGKLPTLARVEGVSITHWGYLPERAKGKHIRNLTLIRKAIEDEPEKPYHHFQFGVQHGTAEDFDQALGAYRTAISMWHMQGEPSDPYVAAMFTSAIVAAIRTRQFELAVQLAADAPKEAFTPDYFYYTALATLELGLTEEAHGLLVRAREAQADPHYRDPNMQARIRFALEKM